MSFAANLRAAMEERRMTATQLSQETGISKPGISQYLSGKNKPGRAALDKLADALDVKPEWLLADHTMDGQTAAQGIAKVTIQEAARLLGKSQQFVRVALQRGAAPFGFAVKMPSGKWSYHISPSKLAAYMDGAA